MERTQQSETSRLRTIGQARVWVLREARIMGEQYHNLHDDLARGIMNRLEQRFGRVADDQVWESLHLSAVNELRINTGLKPHAA